MLTRTTSASTGAIVYSAGKALSGTECSLSVAETHESRQHASVLDNCDHDYMLVKRAPFHGRVVALKHPKVTVVRDQVDHPICYLGTAGKNQVVFTSSADSNQGTFRDGRAFASNTLIKLPKNYTHRTYFPGPYDNLSVTIDADVIAEKVCEQIDGVSARRVMDEIQCITCPEDVNDFYASAWRVLRCGIHCNESGQFDTTLEHSVDLLLQVLVSAVAAAQSRQEELPRPSTRSYIVGKAVSYLEQHVSDPVSIPDISASVGVSARTLRYSFEEIMGVSPSEYFLTLRLEMVRRELLDGSSMKSIYRIAHKYGFCNMSRLAHYYKQTFGELPSQTGNYSFQ